MQWILLLLVKYPDMQAKLQELIDKVVGQDRLPSTEDRSSLAYLDAFIYETMRFTSFVPVTIPHSTTSDVTIEGLHIPKDTVVFINQWSVNHDPLKWKDPHIFDPARFLDENGALDKDITNGVMIFSTGKRRCIGDQIAKVEVFLCTAILLHQCSFESDPSEPLTLDCSYGLTLKPLRFCVSAKLRGKLLGLVSPAWTAHPNTVTQGQQTLLFHQWHLTVSINIPALNPTVVWVSYLIMIFNGYLNTVCIWIIVGWEYDVKDVILGRIQGCWNQCKGIKFLRHKILYTWSDFVHNSESCACFTSTIVHVHVWCVCR